MKSTGIVRRVDDLGRIVLPKELRELLDIETKDPLEIFVDNTSIILQKYEPACIFCNSADQIQQFEGRNICMECLKKLGKLAKE